MIAKTVQETPPNATHWSRPATAASISASSVGRIWAGEADQKSIRGIDFPPHGLTPHLTHGFKVSNDPMFEQKVTDIVGLCLAPPERAVVLCVDACARERHRSERAGEHAHSGA